MSHRPAVRRRGEALEQAILDAAWEEFQEVGFAKLTMEGVAKRAGTSKPVLYRRWTDRTDLILACAASRMPSVDSIPDTGSLRGDTIALLSRLRDRMRQVGPMLMLTMLHEITLDPSFRRTVLKQFLERLGELMNEAVLGRAIARGEIAEEQLTDRLRRLPLDLARNEFLITGDVTDEAVEEIVDQVFLPALQSSRAEAAAKPTGGTEAPEDPRHP